MPPSSGQPLRLAVIVFVLGLAPPASSQTGPGAYEYWAPQASGVPITRVLGAFSSTVGQVLVGQYAASGGPQAVVVHGSGNWLLSGYQASSCQAVNQFGDAAGWFQSSGLYRAFLRYSGGQIQVFRGLPGGTGSQAFGTNGLDQAAGVSTNAQGVARAVWWASPDSDPTDLGTPLGRASAAYGVNDIGQVVGDYADASGVRHAFIWDALNGLRDLAGLLPGLASSAVAINATGSAAGAAEVGPLVRHAVKWDADGTVHDLGTIGGLDSYAVGISGFGLVVGSSQAEDGTYRAFFATYDGSTPQQLRMFDLTRAFGGPLDGVLPQGTTLTSADSVSDDARIEINPPLPPPLVSPLVANARGVVAGTFISSTAGTGPYVLWYENPTGRAIGSVSFSSSTVVGGAQVRAEDSVDQGHAVRPSCTGPASVPPAVVSSVVDGIARFSVSTQAVATPTEVVVTVTRAGLDIDQGTLTLLPATVLEPSPAAGVPGSAVSLSCALRILADRSPLGGQPVLFAVDGQSLAPAITDGSGVATAQYTIPASAVCGSTIPFTVHFDGSDPYAASDASQTITVNYPAPTLRSLSPSSARPGSAGVVLSVTGTGFTAGSAVRWNGSARPTTYVSATQLTASIPASDLVTAGTASVTAYNPNPGGGVSGSATFTIGEPKAIALTAVDLRPGTANIKSGLAQEVRLWARFRMSDNSTSDWVNVTALGATFRKQGRGVMVGPLGSVYQSMARTSETASVTGSFSYFSPSMSGTATITVYR